MPGRPHTSPYLPISPPYLPYISRDDKLLDDTAFFAAQAKVTDGFAFTTSFTTYMVRPVPPGVQLVARGRVTSASKALVVAESTLTEAETGKLVAQGSGTFQKGPFPLTAVGAYAEG